MNENMNLNEPKKKNIVLIVILTLLAIVLVGGAGYLIYKNYNKPEEAKEEYTNLIDYLTDNYDKYVIDGSTSMIPLHEALEERFGQGKEITHSNPISAFNDFVDGKTDILLGIDYLDKYFEEAEAKNVTINKKEITKEALVFLKNKRFEVDNLTIDQIKKIYNYEVKHWNELGVETISEDILAISRNENSESGMVMMKFLATESVNCEDESCVFVNSITGVVNALANSLTPFDGTQLTTYNMYTFTEKQYPNNNITTFKVNNIAPTDETIYNEEYPAILYNYIYYKDDEAKEFGEKLYEYLLSDEGQRLIIENGYIPLRQIDDVNIKNNERNCQDNFVEEICIEKEGYNESINKYVKFTIEGTSEKYEYFDTVEEYIFSKSDLTEDDEKNITTYLADFFNEAKRLNLTLDRITFEKQDNGDILMYTGNCTGSACIWFDYKEGYELPVEVDYPMGSIIISSDYQTIKDSVNNIEIPIKDLLNAFELLPPK